jgi:Family of unknown function (DUF6011)
MRALTLFATEALLSLWSAAETNPARMLANAAPASMQAMCFPRTGFNGTWHMRGSRNGADGKHAIRCGFCDRQLRDEISRLIGAGPDCGRAHGNPAAIRHAAGA